MAVYPPLDGPSDPSSESSHQQQHPAALHVSSEVGSSIPTVPQHRAQGSSPSLSGRDRGFSTTSSGSAGPAGLLKRKPLPPTASPLVARFSDQSLAVALQSPPKIFDDGTPRPYLADSPTVYDFPRPPLSASSERFSSPLPPRNKEDFSSSNRSAAVTSSATDPATDPRPQTLTSLSLLPPKPVGDWSESNLSPVQRYHARLTSDTALSAASQSTTPWYTESVSSHARSVTMSIFSNKPNLPNLTLPSSVPARGVVEESSPATKQAPKSPEGSKLRSFFGWGNTSPISTSTSFSDKGYSPIPSPLTPNQLSPDRRPSKQHPPAHIDIPLANANAESYFADTYLHIPSPTPTPGFKGEVEEMEEELKVISEELAASIRRELDLEDLVERLQSEAANPPGRRTSDYFSDSGTSSIKAGEFDVRTDELERAQRKTEQEKAQIRLELVDKVQQERSRRKELELHIQELEQRASQVDVDKLSSTDANGRLKDLENTCEDLRRRLAEERQMKDNFEDLLTALKSELQGSSNERDNLKDEIVPQLRARVEGLEAQAAENERLAYETAKMQQELQALRIENQNLINARKAEPNRPRFNSIAEETPPVSPDTLPGVPGLFRSNSLARRPAAPSSRPSSLSRSSSVKGPPKAVESREALAERVKDVEMQRDALHKALKNLLDRQEHQARENEKKIRQLELERDRALTPSPRRSGFNRDVENLRHEINTLRRRADEAIEQKWQCEKGLSGLKMDLDRAEQEIGSLRTLLEANDIAVPEGIRPGSRGSDSIIPMPSTDPLEQSYRELKKSYAEALDRIQNLESSTTEDEDTKQAMQQLQRSLSDAVAERDFANREVEVYRLQAESLKEAEKEHLKEEVALADELRNSAKRVEELATQVRQQIASNSTLRQRLSDTIQRGEKEQKANASRITFMQEKLKSLEEQLVAAQNASEEMMTKHEEDIRELKETHSFQLSRVKDGLRSPRVFSPKTPLSPLFAGTSARSPRLTVTSSGPAMSLEQQTQTDSLKARIVELEAALADADREMEEVVGKMNIAQIEVMELQNEREEAVRLTKRLQGEIEQEKLNNFQARFNTLQT